VGIQRHQAEIDRINIAAGTIRQPQLKERSRYRPTGAVEHPAKEDDRLPYGSRVVPIEKITVVGSNRYPGRIRSRRRPHQFMRDFYKTLNGSAEFR
jgi:hypothetical protein